MAASRVARVLGVIFGLLPAACAAPPPPEPVYSPPNYSYLGPLAVNLDALEIEDDWAPGPDDVGALSPVRPLDALRRMARDRLTAVGTTGRAVFRIEDASIRRVGGNVTGDFAVRLDIVAANGAPRGYAEAHVTRTAILADEEALRPTLYALTKDMMRDMNVEFEYQVRRYLGEWLMRASPPSRVLRSPVEQRPLSPPGEQPAPAGI